MNRTLLIALSLAGCALGSSRFALKDSFTRDAAVGAVAGREVCAEMDARGGRRPEKLTLELSVVDATGEPIPSVMPELADGQGHLKAQREIWIERRSTGTRRVCTFLPLEAFPNPRSAYGVRLVLRDSDGRVVSSKDLEPRQPREAAGEPVRESSDGETGG